MTSDRVRNSAIPFVIIFISLLPFLFFSKGDLVLEMNKLHNDFLDKVFIVLSALGNGVTIAICAIFLLLKSKFRYLYEFTIAFLIQLASVSLFKQVLFADAHRPYKYFTVLKQEHLLNTVEGVHIYLYDSFPSGHTATIFLLAMFFALFFNNRRISWVLFIIAFFVGLSRMYLVQHFYMDVYVGMLFGSCSALLAHYIVSKKQYSWFDKSLDLNFFESKKKSESAIKS